MEQTPNFNKDIYPNPRVTKLSLSSNCINKDKYKAK